MSYYPREKELFEKNVEYRKMTKSLYYQIVNLLELYHENFKKIDNNIITNELQNDINGRGCLVCNEFWVISWGNGDFTFHNVEGESICVNRAIVKSFVCLDGQDNTFFHEFYFSKFVQEIFIDANRLMTRFKKDNPRNEEKKKVLNKKIFECY